MKNILSDINRILSISDSYQAPEKIMGFILENGSEKKRIFSEMSELFRFDFSFDWFHQYFEDEHADRKNNKQDFTPECISKLVSQLIGSDKGVTYEPAAGTGGMLINNWHRNRIKSHPFDYKPNEHLVICDELSDKTIPFLLFNLSIRGISGIVFHGNTLSEKYKKAYILVNKHNSITEYSDVYPINKNILIPSEG